MKKALSILLLIVFLFNVGGYYIVFWALRYQAQVTLTARLDAGSYTNAETIELKIPVTLPYPLQQRDFERMKGKFEYNGLPYQLVKHKHENDTLYVVCIRDHRDKQLENTMTDYVKISNDLPGTNGKALTYLGKLVKDYTADTEVIFEHNTGWIQLLSYTEVSESINIPPRDVQSPPPKA